MKFIKKHQIWFCMIVCAVLGLNVNATAVESFVEDFSGPQLDPSWITSGSGFFTNSGQYQIRAGGGNFNSVLIRRESGEGSFEAHLRIQNIEREASQGFILHWGILGCWLCAPVVGMNIRTFNRSSVILNGMKESGPSIGEGIPVDSTASLDLKLRYEEPTGTCHYYYSFHGPQSFEEMPGSPVIQPLSSVDSSQIWPEGFGPVLINGCFMGIWTNGGCRPLFGTLRIIISRLRLTAGLSTDAGMNQWVRRACKVGF